MTDPYPCLWACSKCHRKYRERAEAAKCCTPGHEEGWEV